MDKKINTKANTKGSYRAIVFLAAFIIITSIIFLFSRITYKEKLDQRIEYAGINTLELLYTKTTFLSQLYSYSLKTAAIELSNYITDNTTKQDYFNWLNRYYEHIKNTLFLQDVNVYFASDNILIDRKFGDILKIDNSYEYKHQDWYTKALAKPLVPIFSEVYVDAFTKQLVASASICLPDGKGVLGIDLQINTFGTNKFFDQKTLDTTINFLMDYKGEIIAYYSKDNNTYDRNNINNMPFILQIKEKILNSDEANGSFKIKNSDGSKYSIFYKQYHETKYYSVAVIDDNEMYTSIGDTLSKYIIIFIILAFAVLIAYLDGYYLKKRADDSDDVVDMLGNIYYCIYRVNLENKTYNIVRSIGSKSCKIHPTGLYEEFYSKYIRTLDDTSKEEFINTLSIDNLKAMAKSSSFNMDKYFHKNIPGQNEWINIRIIRNKSISKKYILLCFKECGDERERELAHIELLEEAVEALKESAESKRILYSSVSHDMRTPLNCIIGIAELMTASINDKDKILDYIEKIKISGSQLLTLISNFLEMAQSESKALDTSIIEFNLEHKINEICSIFSAVAERDNKTFKVEYNVEHNDIKGDANKLMHILSNILSNAFKYTKTNGLIELSVKEIKVPGISRYEFTIEDNGIGMSEEFLKTIFMPFNRESRADTKNITGAGLGLSIVNSQVRHMGGTINVKSQYEKGTTVTITLPFESVKKQAGSIKEQEEIIEGAEDFAGINILIAEDNVVNMQIITELLKLKHINVTQAFNGQEAVNIFKNSKDGEFDIIILDIQMPVMNGLETAKNIRQMNRKDAKLVPIIALSANVFEEDVAASLEAGMDAHLAKPINLPALYKTFAELLKINNKK